MSVPTSYTSLEPSFTSSIGLPSATFQPGQVVSLLTSTTFIYNLLLIACIAAAGFVYAKGGMLRLQASGAGIQKSNEEFKRGTLGLLGVLSLFLILYTVNRGLLLGDVGLEALRTNASTTPGTPGTPIPGSGTPTGNKLPLTDPAWLQAIQGDAAVRAQLKNSNITVNKNVCGDPTQTNCTTVGGLPQGTLSMLSQLRNSCPGSIVITGGTENGHASHGPGLAPVDISLNDSQLASCIRKFTPGPKLGLCNVSYINFGYIFCDEKNTDTHWHVYK